MKKIAFLLILLVLGGAALASNDSTGTNPGNFLKLGGGARPISLGGAFVALADDINAIYFNPAGLSKTRGWGFSSMYNSYLADISYTNLAFSFSEPRVNLSSGLAIDFVSAGQMEETTAAQPLGTGKTFSPAFIALTAPFAFQILPPLSVGMNLKILSDKISTGEAFGYGLDLGILWDITENISAGFCARNLAGALMETSATLPQTNSALAANYALGMCYRLPFLNLALDYNQPSDNQGTINLGAEYKLNDTFFGRIGFSTRSEENAGGNLGAGVGLKFGILKFDYAYSPYADLGITHRLAFSLFFPGGKAPASTAEAKTLPPPAAPPKAAPVVQEAPVVIETIEEVVVEEKVVPAKKTTVKAAKKKIVKKPAKKPVKKPLPRPLE